MNKELREKISRVLNKKILKTKITIKNIITIIILIVCIIYSISVFKIIIDNLNFVTTDLSQGLEELDKTLEIAEKQLLQYDELMKIETNIDNCKNPYIPEDFHYLELNGIKVFIDSRAEMFIEQMNEGCTVLEDWFNVNECNVNYKEIFEKYNITHVLVCTTDKLEQFISNDEDYKLIHNSGMFSLYEKK